MKTTHELINPKVAIWAEKEKNATNVGSVTYNIGFKVQNKFFKEVHVMPPDLNAKTSIQIRRPRVTTHQNWSTILRKECEAWTELANATGSGAISRDEINCGFANRNPHSHESQSPSEWPRPGSSLLCSSAVCGASLGARISCPGQRFDVAILWLGMTKTSQWIYQPLAFGGFEFWRFQWVPGSERIW